MNRIRTTAPRWRRLAAAVVSVGVVGVVQAADPESGGKRSGEAVATASPAEQRAAAGSEHSAAPKVLVLEKIAADDSLAAKPSGVRCRKVAPLGTRIARTRCVTAEQAAKRQADDRRRLERVQRSTRPPPAPAPSP